MRLARRVTLSIFDTSYSVCKAFAILQAFTHTLIYEGSTLDLMLYYYIIMYMYMNITGRPGETLK